MGENNATDTELPAESKFAAVVFHNIQEVYIPGKDIRCCFTLKPFVVPTSNDWIGLYKVGWKFHHNYLCYEYSPITQRDENNDSPSSQKSVVFHGDKLPQQEAEFYQFCYVTSKGEIRGASYPFQIQYSKPGELECSEVEDENGDTLLIVRNKTTILEDSLAKAYDENAALKVSKEKGEADCVRFQDIILELENQKIALETSLNQQKKAIDEVTNEKLSLEESLNDHVTKVRHLEQASEENNLQTLELQKAVDIEKLRSVQTNEDQKKVEAERAQLWENLLDSKKEVKQLQSMMKETNLKIVSVEEKSKKVRQENEVLNKEHENLLGELKNAQVSMDETKQNNLALERSMVDHIEHMNLLQKENSKLQQELCAVKEEIAVLNEVHKSHLDKMMGLDEQQQMLMEQVKEKDIALSEADEKTDKIVMEMKETETVHQQELQQYEQSILNIQEQLNQERAFNNSLSSASDRQVAELQELLNIQLEKNSSMSQQIDTKNVEIKQLEDEMKAKDDLISDLQEAVSKGKEDLESAKEQEHLLLSAAENISGMDGPYFALQTAHAQLKKQYLQNKKDMENLFRQKNDLKRQLTTLQSELPDSDLRVQMASMKKRNEDLRTRLNMGAEEYKTKFKECLRFQHQLKKLQEGDSGRCTPQSTSENQHQKPDVEENSGDDGENNVTTSVSESVDLDDKVYNEELKQAKEEINKLNNKIAHAEWNLAMENAEKEQRLVEDQELEKHMEYLRRELESKTKVEAENNKVVAVLTEENQNLLAALQCNPDNLNEELKNENEVLREEVLKQKRIVEDLTSHVHELEQPIVRGIQREQPTDSGVSASGQNVCPVCSIYYPPNCPHDKFESHVQSHFSD